MRVCILRLHFSVDEARGIRAARAWMRAIPRVGDFSLMWIIFEWSTERCRAVVLDG